MQKNLRHSSKAANLFPHSSMVLDLLWNREAQTMEVSSNVYEAITWSSILGRVTLKVWTGKAM
jgi:hypothetical protein